jgi:hypothetical protein
MLGESVAAPGRPLRCTSGGCALPTRLVEVQPYDALFPLPGKAVPGRQGVANVARLAIPIASVVGGASDGVQFIASFRFGSGQPVSLST